MNKIVLINTLINYASKNLMLDNRDKGYLFNFLLHKFNIDSPETDEYEECQIDELIKYIKETGIVEGMCCDIDSERFVTEIMGILTPLPSKIEDVFWNYYSKDQEMACKFLYNLQVKNNYIKATQIALNKHWKTEYIDNFLEITINLSKPEKDNKVTARLIDKVSNTYPKCLLCKENLGYAGRKDAPARQNLRTIGFKLEDENWFMQFSPYQYYDEHVIVINEKHLNMKIDQSTFRKLIAFVDLFPNYFIGSNTELPIVGGSILNHEHYQGGKHLMPIFFAPPKFHFTIKKYPGCQIEYLNWFKSCIVLTSQSKEDLISLATNILDEWKKYDDEEVDIIAKTTAQHNTITPIVRKTDGKYTIYLILRNNRTNEKYEDGIFHSHKEYHNIKKEAIGLIEAMGLFILPGRLDRQFRIIKDILQGKISLSDALIETPDLMVHKEMIADAIINNGERNNDEKADMIIKNYIDNVCVKILECTAVFKNNDLGDEHLLKFIKRLDL